jgi:hypothetical protein
MEFVIELLVKYWWVLVGLILIIIAFLPKNK